MQTLLELVQRHSLAYQLQDVVCLKCKLVKADNVAVYCSCSGTFANTRKRGPLRELMGEGGGVRIEERGISWKRVGGREKE